MQDIRLRVHFSRDQGLFQGLCRTAASDEGVLGHVRGISGVFSWKLNDIPKEAPNTT